MVMSVTKNKRFLSREEKVLLQMPHLVFGLCLEFCPEEKGWVVVSYSAVEGYTSRQDYIRREIILGPCPTEKEALPLFNSLVEIRATAYTQDKISKIRRHRPNLREDEKLEIRE